MIVHFFPLFFPFAAPFINCLINNPNERVPPSDSNQFRLSARIFDLNKTRRITIMVSAGGLSAKLNKLHKLYNLIYIYEPCARL